MYMEKGLYIPYAKAVRDVVSIPVICAGRMDDPELATRAVEEGACDFVALGRPLLADPDYVNKLARNQREDIRPCLSCQEGCMGRIQQYSVLNCAVNPACGREKDVELTPALRPKRVLIAGGGVAGCEAARVLALRGHVPVLCEKSGSLGGNLLAGGAPRFKADDLALARWYTHTLEKLGVEIHLNHAVTPEEASEGGYDAVIVATGSNPKALSLPGEAPVYPAAQALLGQVPVGESVVVIGGGLVGCETALWLAERGRQVTLVESMEELLSVNAPVCSANADMLKELVRFKGVDVETGTKAVGWQDGQIQLEGPEGIKSVPADTILAAVGYTSEQTLYNRLGETVPEKYLLGDARRVSNIMYAIWDAYEVARYI